MSRTEAAHPNGAKAFPARPIYMLPALPIGPAKYLISKDFGNISHMQRSPADRRGSSERKSLFPEQILDRAGALRGEDLPRSNR